MKMAEQQRFLRLEKVGYRRNNHWILRDLSMALPLGQIRMLTGPSGCGKTTFLRLLAGLEAPDTGVISVGDAMLSAPGKMVSPWERGIDMLFQSDALWPKQTVGQQIEWVRSRCRRKTDLWSLTEITAELGINELLNRLPAKLSGGEAHRCQLARVLAGQPDILLLDEPLSGQDKKTAQGTARLLGRLLSNAAVTALIVSHETAMFAEFNWQTIALPDINNITVAGG